MLAATLVAVQVLEDSGESSRGAEALKNNPVPCSGSAERLLALEARASCARVTLLQDLKGERTAKEGGCPEKRKLNYR